MKVIKTKRLFCIETVLPFEMLKLEFLNIQTTDTNDTQTLICNVNADFEKIKNFLPEWFNFESLKGNSIVLMFEQQGTFLQSGHFPENLYRQHVRSCLDGGLSNIEHLYKISFKKQQINKRNFSGFLTHYLFEIEQRKQKSINDLVIEN